MSEQKVKAFPASQYLGDDLNGMDLRDWFAGMALQGILAGCYWQVTETDDPIKEAIRMADEMMKAREASNEDRKD